MNALTYFHTAISVLPIGFGLAAFLRHGAIDPKSWLGKLYLGTMLIGSISSFGFIPYFGFTPGQVQTLITLFLLFAGTFTMRGSLRAPGYIQTLSLSASYFMLMVFATTETLKHFPIGRPFASSATDPSLLPIRLGLLLLFSVGVIFQSVKVHANKRLETLRALISA